MIKGKYIRFENDIVVASLSLSHLEMLKSVDGNKSDIFSAGEFILSDSDTLSIYGDSLLLGYGFQQSDREHVHKIVRELVTQE